jgi:hypothetical protein
MPISLVHAAMNAEEPLCMVIACITGTSIREHHVNNSPMPVAALMQHISRFFVGMKAKRSAPFTPTSTWKLLICFAAEPKNVLKMTQGLTAFSG